MSLASLIAGSLIGFLTTLTPVPALYRLPIGILAGVLVIVLLLVGVGTIQTWYRSLRLALRWRQTLAIAILNDNGWDVNNASIYTWTDVSPEDWKLRLEFHARETGLRVRIQTTSAKTNLDRYVAVLNPYGSVYPEEDLKSLSTHNRIVQFVRDGGLFINVADIPFYYAYDWNLKRRLDTTEPMYATVVQGNQVSFAPTRLFDLGLFCKDLGIRILNVEAGKIDVDLFPVLGQHVTVRIQRATTIESNIESCVDSIDTTFPDKSTGKITPLFFARYGEGDFLISLVFINAGENSERRDSIRDAVCKLAVKRLGELRLSRTPPMAGMRQRLRQAREDADSLPMRKARKKVIELLFPLVALIGVFLAILQPILNSNSASSTPASVSSSYVMFIGDFALYFGVFAVSALAIYLIDSFIPHQGTLTRIVHGLATFLMFVFLGVIISILFVLGLVGNTVSQKLTVPVSIGSESYVILFTSALVIAFAGVYFFEYTALPANDT